MPTEAPFRLISQNWNAELLGACSDASGHLRIVCPFIKKAALSRLLGASRAERLQVITRFDLNCFNQGVSDLDALKMVLDAGGEIRGVRHLHAKVYLFGSKSVIATSANVTDAAFLRNHEFGFAASDAGVVATCEEYFNDLWERAGKTVTKNRLTKWAEQLERHQRQGNGVTRRNSLPDHGTDVRGESPFVLPIETDPVEHKAFIKFFGQGINRAPRHMSVADLVAESGCNWACTYPPSKPPRQVQDGDIVYMARIVADDIMIFGKAIGRRHRDHEDLATAAEIKARPWKSKWPRYVRVHDAQFIDGCLGDGVSFYEMMEALRSNAFASTQRNARSGKGNTDPFDSYFRKAHMLLTPQSSAWIEDRLNLALRRHGEVDLKLRRFRPPRGDL